MKKLNTTQVVPVKKSAKRSKGVIADLAKQLTAPSAGKRSNTEITHAIIAELTTPQVSAPAPAPAPSAGVVMGVPNLNSRRINPRAVVREWRIVGNQRKDVWSAGAKYYVQGGEIMIDPLSQRSRFEVAVEIPFIDHYLGKLELVARRSAPATTEVKRIA